MLTSQTTNNMLNAERKLPGCGVPLISAQFGSLYRQAMLFIPPFFCFFPVLLNLAGVFLKPRVKALQYS